MDPALRPTPLPSRPLFTGDGEKYTYKYNPWGQLVSIYDVGYTDYAAVYTYNGLGHRISEQTDTNDSGNTGAADKALNSNDPVFYIAVDPQGRRVSTFRNTDTYPKETFIHHPSGLRGPSFPGGIMARDRNGSLTDPTKWATETASSTRGERNYYAANPRGDIIAMFENSGVLSEQYRYSPTGVPFGLPKGCVKSDGSVDASNVAGTDYYIVEYARTHSYEARADLNFDGAVTTADTAIVTGASGVSAGRGIPGVGKIGNRITSDFSEITGVGFFSTIRKTHSGVMSTGLGRQLGSELAQAFSRDTDDQHIFLLEASEYSLGAGSVKVIARPPNADLRKTCIALCIGRCRDSFDETSQGCQRDYDRDRQANNCDKINEHNFSACLLLGYRLRECAESAYTQEKTCERGCRFGQVSLDDKDLCANVSY